MEVLLQYSGWRIQHCLRSSLGHCCCRVSLSPAQEISHATDATKKKVGGSICYFAGYHQISVIEIEPFYIPAIKCIKQYFSYSLTNSICWKLLELYQCNCWKKKLNSNHLFGQWLFIPYPHSMNRYAFIKVTPLEFYALVFALQFVFFLIEKKQQNAYFLIFFK